MSIFSLAAPAAACYTPAAMADQTTAPASELLIHVQAAELRVSGWQDAIAQLSTTLAQAAGLPDATPLIESAMQREGCEPTYLGKGMALPHARVAGLRAAGVCIAHSPAGIPWHDERAQLLIFLAVPEEKPELYLQLMSRLVRWRLRLADEQLAQPLLPAAEWEEELHTLLMP